MLHAEVGVRLDGLWGECCIGICHDAGSKHAEVWFGLKLSQVPGETFLGALLVSCFGGEISVGSEFTDPDVVDTAWAADEGWFDVGVQF